MLFQSNNAENTPKNNMLNPDKADTGNNSKISFHPCIINTSNPEFYKEKSNLLNMLKKKSLTWQVF